MTFPLSGLLSFAALLLAASCSRPESEAIVQAAQIADDAWTCPPDSTRTFEIGNGRYRLSGCQRVAIYVCTGRPPACSRQR